MKRILFGALLVSAIAVAGCGDDDAGNGSSSASPEAAASNSAETAMQIEPLVSDPGNEGALGAVHELQGHVQALAGASAGAGFNKSTNGPYALAHQAQISAACMSTSGSTTTYTDCSVGPVTMNGTVTTAAETVTIDVVVDVDASVYDASAYATAGTPASAITIDSVQVHEHGALDFAGDTINGTMVFDIETTITIDLDAMGGGMPGMTGGTQTTTQTNTTAADFAITLTDHCPTGGTLTVTSDSGLGGNTPVVATYGPACGDVSVE